MAVALALSQRLPTLFWALALAVLLSAAARLDLRLVARRLAHLNMFVAFLWATLPWSVPGRTAAAVGGIELSSEGIRLAFEITVKSNAIVLILTSLVATIEPSRLGSAMSRLAVPDKLALLLVLVVRYTDLIHEEYARLRRAMKARAFKPGFSRRSLRTFGYLTGMLLVRGMERSERVLAAMKCRGFDGTFRCLSNQAVRMPDIVFAAAAALHVCAWLVIETL